MEDQKDKKQYICWIDLEKRILTLHEEEGYIRKEFDSREAFRDFILVGASKGYRMK